MTNEKNLGWHADEYSKLASFDSDWRDSWWSQDYLELMAKRLRFADVSSVLDVGCGAGHWGQRIATLLADDAEVTGVDHEGGFLDSARDRACKRPQRFEYRVASAETLPFEDATFDLVTCQTVLIHVADAKVALTEMLRVLKPGGVLLAAEPNNLVNAIVTRVGLPRPPFEETLRLLSFEETCMRGKSSLGQGDGSIGEWLPRIFQELGLDDRRAHTNDQTGTLLPPYDSPVEQAWIEAMRSSAEAGYSPAGDRDTARRLFRAGGGNDSSFDELWELEIASQRRRVAEIDAGRFVTGGGYQMYVVSGRKPLG